MSDEDDDDDEGDYDDEQDGMLYTTLPNRSTTGANGCLWCRLAVFPVVVPMGHVVTITAVDDEQAKLIGLDRDMTKLRPPLTCATISIQREFQRAAWPPPTKVSFWLD